jgi:hypothetical protein
LTSMRRESSSKGSDAYRQLAPKTQRDYARHLDRFASVGHWPIGDFKRRHIKALQKPLLKTPRAAKYFAQVCSLLFAFAIDELDLIEVNPASRLKRPGSTVSYKAWSDEECARFEASRPARGLLTAYISAATPASVAATSFDGRVPYITGSSSGSGSRRPPDSAGRRWSSRRCRLSRPTSMLCPETD